LVMRWFAQPKCRPQLGADCGEPPTQKLGERTVAKKKKAATKKKATKKHSKKKKAKKK